MAPIVSTPQDARAAGIIGPRTGITAANLQIRKYYTEQALFNVASRFQVGHGNMVSILARDVIENAAQQITGEIGRQLEFFAKSLRTKTARNRDKRVTRIHTVAGQKAQESMLRAYDRNRASARKAVGKGSGFAFGNVPSSPRRNRFANGKLRRALASPQQVFAQWDGVAFINMPLLDRTAAQWYRLNFGAGSRGQQTTRSGIHQIRFFGEVASELSIQAYGPSGSFRMPAGVWLDRGGLQLQLSSDFSSVINIDPPNRRGVGGFRSPGGPARRRNPGGTRRTRDGRRDFPPGSPDPRRRGLDQFITAREARGAFPTYSARGTKGIKGFNFIDTGVRRMADELGKGWTILLLEWFKEAAVQQSGPIRAIGVDPQDAAAGYRSLAVEARKMKLDLVDYRSVLSKI